MEAPLHLNLNLSSGHLPSQINTIKEIDRKIENTLIRAFKSPTFYAFVCLGTLTGLSFSALIRITILSPKLLKTTLLALSLAFIFLLKHNNHKIWFEFSLLCIKLEAAFIKVMSKLLPFSAKRNWYDEIQFSHNSTMNHKLLLGAIPLATMSHHRELQNLLSDRSFSVLSVLKTFENSENGCIGSPVFPTDWAHLSIPHKQIEIFDLHPIPINELNEGVNFIHEQLQQRHVYVHCKVGRSRSAMMIIGYIMKYCQHELVLQEGTSLVQQAINFVRKSRPQIYINSVQKQALNNYAVTLMSNSVTL
ncbi:Uncharacterized protein PRO82_001521 [Candidatus Protochlamydia amoebophila]|uniref:dual specificity protein phosphatase family protein n=1 Tax=Candidatus Protochlamydia amoebophila TaxID=362787 RepID=UPI001BC9FCFA|nr:dual specificity protein phosphatase family protein [Candidatus Protochlamydia amoebophila]MBS4164203.1 Uncharacterized protein [Candidatus Protochlamydia amoebophila]